MSQRCSHPRSSVIGPPPDKPGRKLCLACHRDPEIPLPLPDKT